MQQPIAKLDTKGKGRRGLEKGKRGTMKGLKSNWGVAYIGSRFQAQDRRNALTRPFSGLAVSLSEDNVFALIAPPLPSLDAASAFNFFRFLVRELLNTEVAGIVERGDRGLPNLRKQISNFSWSTSLQFSEAMSRTPAFNPVLTNAIEQWGQHFLDSKI